MAKKLFVSNLDFEISVDQLREMFSEVGGVVSVVIATDRDTKRSKGFAFVEMETDESASAAIESINNKTVNGRPVKVVEDRGKGGGDTRESSGGGERPKFEPLPAIQRTQLFKRKRKLDPFTQSPTKTVDYKDTKLLSKFISERGKILSRRLTGLTAYNQRKVSKAIKRAQNLGLMPSSTV
jgi:small subunit ribosomal protein S18